MDEHNTHSFRGFDDWIEIFRAGRHTAASGVTVELTEADLDQIVANHSPATAAPAVIGHPKTDDPAYGWTDEIKRVGKTLLAKFRDVMPEFAEGVEAGRYRNRSVKITKTADGWRLVHVGWLGAAPPAVPGLAPMSYSAPEGETFEFAVDSYTPSVLARVMRRMRELLIEKFGMEAADRVLPDYEAQFLEERAAELRQEERAEATPAFSQHTAPKGEPTVHTFTQADLDRAKEEAAREAREAAHAEFNAQLSAERRKTLASEIDADIKALIDAGQLTPAQAAGMAEFMLSLPEGVEIEFSAAEGGAASKVAPLQWFRDFAKRLPKQIDTGESDAGRELEASASHNFNAPQGAAVSAERLALHNKALDYAKKNGVEYVVAVRAIEQQGS